MGRRPEQTFLQRIHTEGQQAHEKMFNITNYQRNVDQNYGQVLSHTIRMAIINSQITNAGEDAEKRKPSYTVSGNVNWYNHYGKQYGCTSENSLQKYHMTQESHSQAYIWTKFSLKKTHAPTCSLHTIHNNQDMETT